MFLRYISRWTLIIVTLLVSGAALAADIKVLAVENSKTMLSLTGEIVPGDKAKPLNAIGLVRDSRPIEAVQLHSPGGSILEAVEIAGVLRVYNVATSVIRGETCASACFIIFTAGARKFAAPGAKIGVHSARDETTGKETAAATLAMARFLRELGVSEKIIGKLALARPEKMAWLTMDDLHEMGVATLHADRSLVSGLPFCSSPLQSWCLQEVEYDPFKEVTDAAILNQLTTPNMFDQFDPPGKRRRGGKTYYQTNGHWYKGAP
jgi:hypothetical protein